MKPYTTIKDLPILLEKGFVVKKLPSHIVNDIDFLYNKAKKFTREETIDEKLSVNGKSELNLVSRYGHLRDTLVDNLLPLHEEAFNTKLIPSVMYGIRKYHKGSSLDMHIDKFITHHVGSIIVVDKDLNGQEDWPLHIVTNQGVEEKVYLNVGDIIFYESARLFHGRPTPLLGKYYSILMTHLAIDGYKYKPDTNLL